jgi:hypothetical protein
MRKSILLSCCLLLLALSIEAQNMRKTLKRRTAEAGVYGCLGYYGNPHWGVGTTVHYLHGVGRKKQWFSFGGGLRINMLNTKKREYSTSSSQLSALNPGGADTIYMPEVQTNTLNAYGAIKIHIKRGVDIFFTGDIGGINFGDSKTAYFRSYETGPATDTFRGTPYKSEPYAFNLFTGDASSYGTLMAEAYGSFRLNDQLRWRLGVNFVRNEYKIDRNIPMNGKRFYQNHWMVLTGIAVDVRWKKNKAQEFLW